MVHCERIYKEGDLFYKKYQKFKGHLRPTTIDGRRQFQASRHPRYSYCCPKSPRKSFREDYVTFKDKRGYQEIYFRVEDTYDSDTTVGQLQVVTPAYKIENNRITCVYNIYRGWYPTSILIIEPIDYFPREKGDITPGEKCIDSSGIHGRDSDMFVALRGYQVSEVNRGLTECNDASMTGAGHYLPNPYNEGYDYKDGALVKHVKDERD